MALDASSLFEIRINDTSPLLAYTGNWTQCFSVSGCVPGSAGAYGVGESYHATNDPAAGLYVTFSGESIELYGDYDEDAGAIPMWTVDNNAYSAVGPTSGVLDSNLAGFSGLSNTTTHSLSVYTNGTGFFNFTHVDVTLVSSQALTNYTVQYWDPSIIYQGNWTNPTVEGLPNGTARTNEAGASARLSFQGVAVVVYASLNNGHGSYNITLDGQTYQYNAAGQSWLVPSTIIYYAANVLSDGHILIMTNSGAGGETTFTLNNVVVVQVAPETSNGTATAMAHTTTAIASSSTALSSTVSSSPTTAGEPSETSSAISKGAIAGGVAGGVVGLVLLGLAAWLLLRRCRRAPGQVPFSPYVVPPESPPAANEEKATRIISINSPFGSAPSPPSAAVAPVTISPPVHTGPSASSKTDAAALSSALAAAGVGSNPDPSLIHDSDAAHEVVDRVLELLASRIDPYQPESEGATTSPPAYKDTRRRGVQ